MKPRRLDFIKLLLYYIILVAFAAPLALGFSNFGHDLLTDMATIHLTAIYVPTVIVGGLILCKLLRDSGRD